MKTATVTWITYNNYGTLLQAYALQKKIEQLGNKNVILSDREILKAYQADKRKSGKNIPVVQTSHKSENRFFRMFNCLRHPGRLYRSILARTNREKYERPYEESQQLCINFKKNELNILDCVTTESLSMLNEQFDVFITGSDQVWSVFDSIFNPYYYLDFVTQKKIAYAPSLGTDKISEKTSEKVKKLLEDYIAVSVRERVSSLQLSEMINKEVEWVADPTLLHDQAFWNKFAIEVPVKKKKYLLCYFLENREWYFNYAKKMAKKLHLNIVLIPNKWEYVSNEYVIENGVGPKEFVSLIQHAEYVLTDSYHGSIFSLIFERNFQYLLRFSYDDPNSQNIRIQSLFDFLELNDRIVTENTTCFPKITMEYKLVNKKIADFRVKSIQYLEDNLR